MIVADGIHDEDIMDLEESINNLNGEIEKAEEDIKDLRWAK